MTSNIISSTSLSPLLHAVPWSLVIGSHKNTILNQSYFTGRHEKEGEICDYFSEFDLSRVIISCYFCDYYRSYSIIAFRPGKASVNQFLMFPHFFTQRTPVKVAVCLHTVCLFGNQKKKKSVKKAKIKSRNNSHQISLLWKCKFNYSDKLLLF